MTLVGTVTWADGIIGQHAIPITSGGTPYVVFVDEHGHGGRVFDIRDVASPREIAYFNPGGNGTRAPGS